LHSPHTLTHRTTELLQGSFIPALEDPSRITSILTTLSPHRTITTIPSPQSYTLTTAIPRIHESRYLHHLQTIHHQWLSSGLLTSPSQTVLPDCFPPINRALVGIDTHGIEPPECVSARAGYYMFDMSAGVGEHTWDAALASADLAVRGAQLWVSRNNDDGGHSDPGVVLALCRPPGHHCAADIAGGYCYLNNTAIAVAELLSHLSPDPSIFHTSPITRLPTLSQPPAETPQITILDLDYHHGNGTQKLFYAVSNPGYISLHSTHDYPYYSGHPSERGSSSGMGYNVNIPLPDGTTITPYLTALDNALDQIETWGTEWVVVSLGLDTMEGDPLGRWGLKVGDYEVLGRRVGRLRAVKKRGVLVVLEGGYRVDGLGEGVGAFLRG
ncbi:histone deacetylase superfamily, partial [Ascodesmis nigricans]